MENDSWLILLTPKRSKIAKYAQKSQKMALASRYVRGLKMSHSLNDHSSIHKLFLHLTSPHPRMKVFFAFLAIVAVAMGSKGKCL